VAAVSCDYETKHYKAYYHRDKGMFAVYEKGEWGGDAQLANFSPDDVAELAEIAADFMAAAEDDE
jgi:hypothetical protein